MPSWQPGVLFLRAATWQEITCENTFLVYEIPLFGIYLQDNGHFSYSL